MSWPRDRNVGIHLKVILVVTFGFSKKLGILPIIVQPESASA